MLGNANVKDPTDITTDVVGTTENNAYINSTDLSEILGYLTIGNIFQNIVGKK